MRRSHDVNHWLRRYLLTSDLTSNSSFNLKFNLKNMVCKVLKRFISTRNETKKKSRNHCGFGIFVGILALGELGSAAGGLQAVLLTPGIVD